MPSANRQRDVDWILSAGSNCHVVKSLACFSSYTPLRLQLKGSGAHPVHRVGTVKLHTLIPSTDRNGGPRPRTVISNDVLYVPSSTVNIGGAPVWQQSELFRFEDKCTLSYKRANKPAVMLVTPFLTKLWLAGAQPNETSIPTKGRPKCVLKRLAVT